MMISWQVVNLVINGIGDYVRGWALLLLGEGYSNVIHLYLVGSFGEGI